MQETVLDGGAALSHVNHLKPVPCSTLAQSHITVADMTPKPDLVASTSAGTELGSSVIGQFSADHMKSLLVAPPLSNQYLMTVPTTMIPLSSQVTISSSPNVPIQSSAIHSNPSMDITALGVPSHTFAASSSPMNYELYTGDTQPRFTLEDLVSQGIIQSTTMNQATPAAPPSYSQHVAIGTDTPTTVPEAQYMYHSTEFITALPPQP